MKNSKTLLLITLCLFVSSLLQAQELKTEIAKPIKSTVPDPGSRPVLAPDIPAPSPLTTSTVNGKTAAEFQQHKVNSENISAPPSPAAQKVKVPAVATPVTGNSIPKPNPVPIKQKDNR